MEILILVEVVVFVEVVSALVEVGLTALVVIVSALVEVGFAALVVIVSPLVEVGLTALLLLGLVEVVLGLVLVVLGLGALGLLGLGSLLWRLLAEEPSLWRLDSLLWSGINLIIKLIFQIIQVLIILLILIILIKVLIVFQIFQILFVLNILIILGVLFGFRDLLSSRFRGRLDSLFGGLGFGSLLGFDLGGGFYGLGYLLLFGGWGYLFSSRGLDFFFGFFLRKFLVFEIVFLSEWHIDILIGFVESDNVDGGVAFD